MSSTPQVPIPIPADGAGVNHEEPEVASATEVEEEIDVVSAINDPGNEDIFEHLRPPKE